MFLETLDWVIIASFFAISLGIGLYSAKAAGKNTKEFFLSGKNMPWWLLGVSMVATTFSADTPNLVTDIVRQNGVSGNWGWWAFLLTGMLTVFIYAKLWQRSSVLTDLEFYEIRYGGKMAALLRGFRAIYLGVFFNILVIATVSLAMIKIAAVMLGWSPLQTLLICSSTTLIYSMLGGLKGIILTDFFQFFLGILATFGAAYFILDLPEIGGLNELITHSNVVDKLDFFPDFNDAEALVTLLILPLAVQWWSVWYPGSEPGGGGYIAQRMLSAKDEKSAAKATLLFNAAHYALRPWPWIIVALASLVVFPDIESMKVAFPNVDQSVIGHDFAYPAMLSYLPSGMLGLVIAGLMAAFMSTLSTHLNWGASYIVHDYYHRFKKPNATEKELVYAGKISMLLLMLVAGIFALMLSNALQAFQILLQIGAGTGLIFILRWFWWRINAYSEITAMLVSFLLAVYMQVLHPMLFGETISGTTQMLLGVGLTTLAWLIVTLKTSPESDETLIKFYKLVQAGGPGWAKIRKKIDLKELDKTKEAWDVPRGVLLMLLGSLSIYSLLFATGNFIYGEAALGGILLTLSAISSGFMFKIWK
jgi:Na+/proline symporter